MLILPLTGSNTQVGTSQVPFSRGFVIGSGSVTNPFLGGVGVNEVTRPADTYGILRFDYNSISPPATCNTTYYARAFQSSSGCIIYSDLKTVTTIACPSTSSCLPFSASTPTNFGGACSETITQTLYTDYSGSWPPTQAYLDGGGVFTVYTSAGCAVASPNTYYAFR